MAEDAEPAHEAVVLQTFAPNLQPVGRGKVDRLGHVVAVVEAGVVAAREGDDKLAGVLIHAVDGDPVGLQHVGVHGGDNVVEQVGLGLKELLGAAAHHLLRLLSILGRNPVPCLRKPKKYFPFSSLKILRNITDLDSETHYDKKIEKFCPRPEQV